MRQLSVAELTREATRATGSVVVRRKRPLGTRLRQSVLKAVSCEPRDVTTRRELRSAMVECLVRSHTARVAAAALTGEVPVSGSKPETEGHLRKRFARELRDEDKAVIDVGGFAPAHRTAAVSPAGLRQLSSIPRPTAPPAAIASLLCPAMLSTNKGGAARTELVSPCTPCLPRCGRGGGLPTSGIETRGRLLETD